MTKMRINGVWITEEIEMKQGIVEAFKSLLSETEEWRASIDGLSFQTINEEEAARLELPFTVDEVFTALNDLNGDNAPGPDGFTMTFWQFSWEIGKEDIMRMFKEFFETGEFVKNLNNTFLVLVLVPKKGGAEELKDFRPISLVGSLYKLIAKVL